MEAGQRMNVMVRQCDGGLLGVMFIGWVSSEGGADHAGVNCHLPIGCHLSTKCCPTSDPRVKKIVIVEKTCRCLTEMSDVALRIP